MWEKALRKLRGHLMPPPGLPQPPQKDADEFVAWRESTLDSHPAAQTLLAKAPALALREEKGRVRLVDER